jgi:amino acid permease
MPLSLARHIGFMRHFATVSVACLVFLVLVVAYILKQRGLDSTATAGHVWFGTGDKTIFLYMNSLNNIVFAYNNQFNVPQLTGELNPQGMRRVTWMAVISSLFSCLLYIVVSLTGVLAFGVAENQKDTLVLDLAPDKQYWFVVASLVSVMFSCLMACEFHIYPVRQFAGYLVRKARGRDANSEETDKVIYGRSLTRWYDIVSAVGIVSLSIIVSISLSSVQTLFNFVGAFAAAYISYVIPPLWLILIRRQQKGFVWWRPDILFSLFVFSLGIFFFFFGTYSAIVG